MRFPGSMLDPEDFLGLAHFLEHMVRSYQLEDNLLITLL